MERRPLKYADQKRLDLHHNHSLRKPLSYFLEPLNLPPEDLTPPDTAKVGTAGWFILWMDINLKYVH